MVTREELYDLVWSQPMTKVCAKFGVSSGIMVRVCEMLNVPRPPMGYWAKLAVGKAPPVDPLPEAAPGQPETWDGHAKSVVSGAPRRPAIKRAKKAPAKSGVPAIETHPLIRGVRADFLRSRPVENGGYLKPFKRLLPEVSSSAAQLDRALSIANKLYNEIEAAGGRLMIASQDLRWYGKRVDEQEVLGTDRRYSFHSSSAWSPMRPTIAYFGDIAIAIAVVEMSAQVVLRYVGGDYIRETEYQANPKRFQYQHTFTTLADLPIGRIRVFASASSGANWSANWQEKSEGTLEATIPQIAKEIKRAIPAIADQISESRRQAEIRHQEWLVAEDRRKRAEDRRRIEDSIKTSTGQLQQVIERWQDCVSACKIDPVMGVIGI